MEISDKSKSIIEKLHKEAELNNKNIETIIPSRVIYRDSINYDIYDELINYSIENRDPIVTLMLLEFKKIDINDENIDIVSTNALASYSLAFIRKIPDFYIEKLRYGASSGTPEIAFKFAYNIDNGKSYDITRNSSSRSAKIAYLYAKNIDEAPHPVTQKSSSSIERYERLYSKNILNISNNNKKTLFRGGDYSFLGSEFKEFIERLDEEIPFKAMSAFSSLAGRGSSRAVFFLNKEYVIKININPGNKSTVYDGQRNNKLEADTDFQQDLGKMVPKVILDGNNYEWIVVERVISLSHSFSDFKSIIERFSPELFSYNTTGIKYFRKISNFEEENNKLLISDRFKAIFPLNFILVWQLIMLNYSLFIRNKYNMTSLSKLIKVLDSNLDKRDYYKLLDFFRHIKKNESTLIAKLIKAHNDFGVQFWDLSPRNLGLTIDGKEIVILDASILDSRETSGEIKDINDIGQDDSNQKSKKSTKNINQNQNRKRNADVDALIKKNLDLALKMPSRLKLEGVKWPHQLVRDKKGHFSNKKENPEFIKSLNDPNIEFDQDKFDTDRAIEKDKEKEKSDKLKKYKDKWRHQQLRNKKGHFSSRKIDPSVYSAEPNIVEPTGLFKTWITRLDERVCKLCGPLHEVRIPFDQDFVVKRPNGNISSPVPGASFHPNCRCFLIDDKGNLIFIPDLN